MPPDPHPQFLSSPANSSTPVSPTWRNSNTVDSEASRKSRHCPEIASDPPLAGLLQYWTTVTRTTLHRQPSWYNLQRSQDCQTNLHPIWTKCGSTCIGPVSPKWYPEDKWRNLPKYPSTSRLPVSRSTRRRSRIRMEWPRHRRRWWYRYKCWRCLCLLEWWLKDSLGQTIL